MTSLSDLSTLFSVQGQVAVVTGGATGIGLMISTALENNGAIVYIVGRRKEPLEKAAKERSKYGNIIPIQGDISSKESLKSVAEAIKQKHGYINLLVNNAGVLLAQQPKLPTPADTGNDITKLQEALWNTETPETFRTTFDVNVAGVWFTTVAFLELLHEGNKRALAPDGSGVSSQVITISSLASLRRDSGIFSLSYTVSKAAVQHLGKMMAHYLKDWKIRSNIINPGLYPSEMADGFINEDAIKATIPIGRAGSPDDMAGLVIFLASKAGSYIDGGVHLTDGGRLLSMPSVF
ncbi:NAD-P-binding protein [Rhodofomes roseus]|uniref:NAD-P-binding protein n=1 Tax=Rhodofomes roseus TaxID=34475 RepID=A0ABQ8K407_9APHY|nr:NAD-P-binding protein [Rhodofomes roseus]KAH9831396.1 NAD-P-binding protein [Rhodofomes roseus]